MNAVTSSQTISFEYNRKVGTESLNISVGIIYNPFFVFSERNLEKSFEQRTVVFIFRLLV